MKDTMLEQHRDRRVSWGLAPERLSRRDLLRRLAAGGLGVATVTTVLFGSGRAGPGTDGRVHRGVSVGGVDLGGLTRDAAVARLEARLVDYTTRPVRVQAPTGDRTWNMVPVALGVRFDPGMAVAEALAIGPGRGNPWPVDARFGGLLHRGTHDITPRVTLDEALFAAALQSWSAEATYEPTDAAISVAADGALTVEPDRDGLTLDADGSRAALLDHAARLSSAPVTLVSTPVPAAVTAPMLQALVAQAEAAPTEPLTLRLGERRWTLSGAQVRAALGYRWDGDRLVLALDSARLQPLFTQIAGEAARSGANARLALNADGRYVILPGQEGRALDEAATLAALNAALATGQREVAVAVGPQRPAITAADLAPVFATLDAILNTPLVVGFEEYARTLGRADIQPLLVFTEQPGASAKVTIALDRDRLDRLTARIAADLNQTVRDARFTWRDGAVREVVASRDGREVELVPTGQALEAALLGATGRATPVVAVTRPRVASADKAALVITDRLGYGQTDYRSSIPSRKHNVELATERLNGVLIPPGAVFSFNEAIGEQTVANGYQEAYGIALVGGQGPGTGQVRTVSSIAGGICQVSTTLLQGVFRAGLPIEERNWHLYWVGYASPGVSPTGILGLDATVDDQSGLDFTFRNTTGGWLALEAVADGSTLRIAVYGEDPGWTVRIDEPVITNVRKAETAPVEERTHDLPPGERRQVEQAADGFDAAIRIRTADRDNKPLRDVTFTSSYYPSRNVVQVGVPPGEPLS